MKKYLFLAIAACLGLASCEDVPAPYEIFDKGENGGGAGGHKESSLPYTSANLNNDWTVVTPQGTPWSLGSTYAKASGYNSGETTPTETWLVSPAINTTNDKNAAHITVEHVIAYVKADCPLSNHTMWISTDFDGSDVATAAWTQLNYKPVERTNTSSWDFYPADEVAIPSQFVGQEVYIAFKFVCGSNSTTWELKNFNVLAGEAAESTTPDKPDVPVTGAGSKGEPYNVASAQSASGNAWVEGYIVGYVDGQTYASGATFAVPTEAQTEILLADAADTKDASACIPVQLPAGDIRSALDLFANPTLLGQKVELYGSLEKYFGVNGLKSTSCAILGDKVIGKDPEGTTPDVPVGDAKGTGTAADPFNVAGVLKYTNALGADQNSDKEVYFKGIVSNVKELSSSYNNATFYISDDGSSNNEFYVYRCLGVDKGNVTEDMLKVGDVVLMCGKVVNYKGNTPETVQKEAYIVSINGEGGNDNPGTDPDQPGVDPDQPSDGAPLISVAEFLANKDTETTYRLVGTVKNIKNTQFGNFDLVDATGSIYIYGLLNAAGESKQFESMGIKEGDELTLEGVYSEYNKSPQIKNAQYISHTSGSGVDPEPDPDQPGGDDPNITGESMTIESILAGHVSGDDLPVNKYGTQLSADENTWYTWKFNDILYKGARICQANAIANTLQVQGNASDAAKQGFFFNADPFASDIKSITVVLKVDTSSSTYDPSYSLYAGNDAHPSGNAVTATSTDKMEGKIKVYTQVFDLSSLNCKYFTISNDKAGVLYIDQVIITLN